MYIMYFYISIIEHTETQKHKKYKYYIFTYSSCFDILKKNFREKSHLIRIQRMKSISIHIIIVYDNKL